MQTNSATQRVRVMVADDHVLVRDGLVMMLEQIEDIEIVAAAGDGAEAIELAHECLPDIVLMDVHMPGINGLNATARLAHELASVRVIGLSMYEDAEIAGAMRRAGA
ncbi:MAG: response regulator transcription factor, partial [Phycisphaeraceae bacterium]